MGSHGSTLSEPYLIFPDVHLENSHREERLARQRGNQRTLSLEASTPASHHVTSDRNAQHQTSMRQENISIGNLIGLSSLRGASSALRPSSSGSGTFLRSVSPLLMTSDAGVEGVLGALFRARGLTATDPIIVLRGDGTRYRPRIVGIFEESKRRELHTISGVSPHRLRRGPLLRTKEAKGTEASAAVTEAALDEFRCPICLDIFDRPVTTPCRHVFCVECIIASLLQQSLCPLCRAALYVHNLVVVDETLRDKGLRDLYTRYLSIIVECPKCHWNGSMRNWDAHMRSVDCEFRQQQALPQGQVPPPPITGRRRPSLTPDLSAKSSSSYQQLTTDDQRTAAAGASRKTQHPRRHRRRQANASSTESTPTVPSRTDLSELTTAETTTSSQTESPRVRSAKACPSDELACWLLDNRPGNVAKLYVVTHRMENIMGALAGTMWRAAHHAQAILELNNLPLTSCSNALEDAAAASPLSSSSLRGIPNIPIPSDPQPPFVDYGKTFISMELFGDREGLEWEAYDGFPPLKSTAEQVAVYSFQSSSAKNGLDIAVLIEFLLTCRHKKYNLIGWNCQTFIADLKRTAGVREPPLTVRTIPRPWSYSESLMSFLEHLSAQGQLPVLSSAQLDPNSIFGIQRAPRPRCGTRTSCDRSWASTFQGFLPRVLRRVPASSSSTTSQSSSRDIFTPVPSVLTPCFPPKVRVRAITLCLFPAEDLHRASLWPAATIAGLWTRALDLARPVARTETFPVAASYSDVAESSVSTSDGQTDTDDGGGPTFSRQEPFHRNASHDAAADAVPNVTSPLPACQIRLRYRTLPILLFHLQTLTAAPGTQEETWKPLCYLSIEFRSDCGLWWHVYHTFPPGLHQSMASGGTDFIFSSQTIFPLEQLQSALRSVRDKEYHPTRWSGWEFAETILQTCCPSVAQHLLLPPIAELLDS